jgi:hypothetical protein
MVLVMVLSLLASSDVPVSKQWVYGFIPEIGLSAVIFRGSVWLD